MKTLRRIPVVLAALASLFFLFSSASADIFMKQKVHTDAFQMMGQTKPASDEISSVWIAQDKIRIDNANQSTLVRLDRKVSYVIDHVKKTYFEMPMPGAAASGDEQSETMQQAMAGMMGSVKVTVTPTNETKVINSWKCKKYIQEVQIMMGPMKAEVWATEDIKIDPAQYMKYTSAMLSQMSMGQAGEDMINEVKKIKGVTVLTTSTTTVMGTSIKSSTELLEYKEGTAPAGHFELPAGYKKTKMMGPE
jgi:hypothetical protein